MNPKLMKFKYLPKVALDYMEELLQRNDALEKQNEALSLLVLTLGEDDDSN